VFFFFFLCFYFFFKITKNDFLVQSMWEEAREWLLKWIIYHDGKLVNNLEGNNLEQSSSVDLSSHL